MFATYPIHRCTYEDIFNLIRIPDLFTPNEQKRPVGKEPVFLPKKPVFGCRKTGLSLEKKTGFLEPEKPVFWNRKTGLLLQKTGLLEPKTGRLYMWTNDDVFPLIIYI